MKMNGLHSCRRRSIRQWQRLFSQHNNVTALSPSSSSTFDITNKFPENNFANLQTEKIRKIHITRISSSENNNVTERKNTSSVLIDPDAVNATVLVDELLEYTESLMMTHRSVVTIDENDSTTKNNVHHIIAFSGGIDSSVAATLVHQVAKASSHLSSDTAVAAVLGLNPAVPNDQIQLAEQVADHIGVELQKIQTTEGKDDMYVANNGQACLACKTHLYTCLSSIVQYYQNENNNNNCHHNSQPLIQLYNGTNADDLKDTTRVGLLAAENFQVKSPLQYTPKSLVRVVGKHLGLPNWNYAASPCLRSRLALGIKAIPYHLKTIDHAEQFVKEKLQLQPYHNLRVRLLSQNRAMIEVDSQWLNIVKGCIDSDPSWDNYFVEELGFASVDVRSFKTGSVARKDVVGSTIKETTFDEKPTTIAIARSDGMMTIGWPIADV